MTPRCGSSGSDSPLRRAAAGNCRLRRLRCIGLRAGRALDYSVCRASGSSSRAASACAAGCGTAAAARAAHDRSADRTASGVQSSAAAAGRARCTDRARPRERCVPRPGVRCRDSQFFSVRVRRCPAEVRRVRLRPGERRPMHPTRRRRQVRVRSVLVRGFRLRDRLVLALVRALRRAGPASAMFRVA